MSSQYNTARAVFGLTCPQEAAGAYDTEAKRVFGDAHPALNFPVRYPPFLCGVVGQGEERGLCKNCLSEPPVIFRPFEFWERAGSAIFSMARELSSRFHFSLLLRLIDCCTSKRAVYGEIEDPVKSYVLCEFMEYASFPGASSC